MKKTNNTLSENVHNPIRKIVDIGKIDSTNEKPENTTHSEQFQNPIAKIEDKGKIDAPITHIYGRSPPWLGTCTLIAE